MSFLWPGLRGKGGTGRKSGTDEAIALCDRTIGAIDDYIFAVVMYGGGRGAEAEMSVVRKLCELKSNVRRIRFLLDGKES